MDVCSIKPPMTRSAQSTMRNGALPQSSAPAPAGMSVFGRDSTVLPFRPVTAEEASVVQEISAAALPATKEVCINEASATNTLHFLIYRLSSYVSKALCTD